MRSRAPGEQVLFRGHPSWLSMRTFVLRALLLCLVTGVAAGVASAVVDGRSHPQWVVAAALGTALLKAILGQLRRARTTYWITTQRVVVRRGLLRRRRLEAGLDRVYDVRLRQSLLDRTFGVGTVELEVPGGPPLALRGVEDPRWVAAAVEWAVAERDRAWDGYVPEAEWAPPVAL